MSVLVCAASPLRARADEPAPVPVSAFRNQIASAQAAAEACEASAAACDSPHFPEREQVTGAPSGTFQVNWRWFGEALAAAGTASAAGRAQAMAAVSAHLADLAAGAGSGGNEAAAGFGRARVAATAVLARPEFRAEDQPGWLERQMAKVQDWLLRMFIGMDGWGKRAPWLAPLIEWGCFGLAVAGLLWFLRQSLARQALRISLADSAAIGPRGNRGSADWAHLAEQGAAAGNWREAVHCLYWAAIGVMESRRAWKPDPTRTPREYLRLLPSGSDAQRALRALTGTFEKTWYGRAEADEGHYRAALESLRLLEMARPGRLATASPEGPSASQPLSLPGGA